MEIPFVDIEDHYDHRDKSDMSTNNGGQRSYRSTAQILVNTKGTTIPPNASPQLSKRLEEVSLDTSPSPNPQFYTEGKGGGGRKAYEVVTYYNDIYAASTGLSPVRSSNNKNERTNKNGYPPGDDATHVTSSGLDGRGPSWIPHHRDDPDDYYPYHRLITNGDDGPSTNGDKYFNLNVPPSAWAEEYDGRSTISEMSSVCEFDSDGEEIESCSDQDAKVEREIGKSYSTELLPKDPKETGNNLTVSPPTKSTPSSSLDPVCPLPYHKIDRFGFFGGNQYLPPTDDDENYDRNVVSGATDDNSPPGASSATPSALSTPSIPPVTTPSGGTKKDPKPNKSARLRDKDRAAALAKLRNREKKWKGMLDHWERYSLHKPEKVRERCRKGVPPALRGLAWQYLCGAPVSRGKNTELYRLLSSEDQKGDPLVMDEIRRDLHRQFPYHEMFAHADGAGQRDLFSVLKVYSLMRPADGYCQAQAPLAATLLMQMPAEPAFWCLLSMCDDYLPGYFGPGLEALQQDGLLFYGLLKRHHPPLYRLLRTQGIQPSLCVTEWFMCVYSRTLPWPCVLRIWDIFLSEGISVLFKVGLVLFKLAFLVPPAPRNARLEPDTEGTDSLASSSSPSTPATTGLGRGPTKTGDAASGRTFGSLPVLHTLTGGSAAAALNARFPTMYETMGALQAIKTRPIQEDYLVGEIAKIKIPREAIERERRYLKKRK